MAKLKATPKNFEQAVAVLGNRDSVRLGNNTYLDKAPHDEHRSTPAFHVHRNVL